MENEVFLIEELWMDIDFGKIGYSPKGWVKTEEEAEKVISKGKGYTRDDCYLINGIIPQYRYRKLTKCTT